MLIASIQFNNDDYPYDKQIYIHEIYDRFYYSESSVGESVTYISENFTIGQSLKLIHEGMPNKEYHWKNIDSIGAWIDTEGGHLWKDMEHELKKTFLDITWKKFSRSEFPKPLHMSVTFKSYNLK